MDRSTSHKINLPSDSRPATPYSLGNPFTYKKRLISDSYPSDYSLLRCLINPLSITVRGYKPKPRSAPPNTDTSTPPT